jgi:hypothetical protein
MAIERSGPWKGFDLAARYPASPWKDMARGWRRCQYCGHRDPGVSVREDLGNLELCGKCRALGPPPPGMYRCQRCRREYSERYYAPERFGAELFCPDCVKALEKQRHCHHQFECVRCDLKLTEQAAKARLEALQTPQLGMFEE